MSSSKTKGLESAANVKRERRSEFVTRNSGSGEWGVRGKQGERIGGTKNARATKGITAEEFDAKADAGEDVSEFLDLSSARKFAPGEDETLDLTAQKVNVDFPAWVVGALDREANRIGIPRQSLIKLWIVERLEKASVA